MTETTDLRTLENQPIASAPRAEALCASAGRALIETDEHLAKSADLVKQITALLKTREEERMSFTKPLKEVAKRIEARFKPGDDALKAAKARVIDLQTVYNNQRRLEREAEAKRLQEEADAKALAEAQRLEAEGKTAEAAEVLEDAAQAPPPAPPPPPKVARGDVAGVSFRTVWKVEVVDYAQAVGAVIDNERVRDAIAKACDGLVRIGTRAITGCRIFSTQEPLNR